MRDMTTSTVRDVAIRRFAMATMWTTCTTATCTTRTAIMWTSTLWRWARATLPSARPVTCATAIRQTICTDLDAATTPFPTVITSTTWWTATCTTRTGTTATTMGCSRPPDACAPGWGGG